MKTIAVFSASGRTGITFIKKAVQEYKVKALVRNPPKLSFSHQNLQIIQGECMSINRIQ